jgi:hypothetical protein
MEKHIYHFRQDSSPESEHRLAFRGRNNENRNAPQQNQDQGGEKSHTYPKGEELTKYAKAYKERFQKHLDEIEKKLSDLEKNGKAPKGTRERLEANKKYFQGEFKNWIEKFENLQLNNADLLQQGLVTAEKIISGLEQEVSDTKKDLPDGKTFYERSREHMENKYLEVGTIDALISRNGTYNMYVPELWKISVKGGGKILSEKVQSAGNKFVNFTGQPGMQFEVTVPQVSGDVSYTINAVQGQKRGTLSLDLSAIKKTKDYEAPKVQNDKDVATGRRTPKRQQESKKAGDILKDSQDAKNALKAERDAGRISQKDFDKETAKINEKIDTYSKEYDQKYVQELVRAVREGKMDIAQANTALGDVEKRFHDTYNSSNAEVEFEQNHVSQLIRGEAELPYILKHLGNGKLEFEKNAAYERRMDVRANTKNLDLAANKLAEIFKSSPKGDAFAIGKNLIEALTKENAQKNNLGVYLDKNGDLLELDQRTFGSHDLIVKGFANALRSNPIKALRDLGATPATLEDKYAKATTYEARSQRTSFENTRVRTPKEINELLSKVKENADSLRTSIQNGVFGPEQQKKVDAINNLLAGGNLNGIDFQKVENYVGELIAATASDNSGSSIEMSYDKDEKVLRVDVI